MTDQSNVPATLRSLTQIVAEYDEKREAIAQTIEDFAEAVTRVDMQSTVGGTYAHGVWNRGSPSVHSSTIEASLRRSAWMHVYRGLRLHQIASAADRKRFEQSFEDAPDFTLDNIRATFGHYIADPRHHILKGLAECFIELDPAFKSHSKVKIGVDGLPKRVILRNVRSQFGHSVGCHGADRLQDTLNAIRVAEGQPHLEYSEFGDIMDRANKGRVEWDGMTLDVYKNGNGHLGFTRDKLRTINLALAEFYGDVLPDTPEGGDQQDRDLFRSREVSKDLAYYPTPRRVIDTILRDVLWRDVETVLEPSCGDGRMMDVIREHKPGIRMAGVEVHPERAAEARAKGYGIHTANFLETTPQPKFDLVVMNPPFYGLHWKKHLAHAIKFLTPRPDGQRWGGGCVTCILPATAFYDGHLADMGLVAADAHTSDRGWVDSGWRDLPVASFAESGTNVPTGYITIHARR